MNICSKNTVNQFLNILLADDDEDDRAFFQEAMEDICSNTKLFLFEDGEGLMKYLRLPTTILPDLIFLDLNMPIKNGMQCLKEIRRNPSMDQSFITIFSTSCSEKDIEDTFVNGANIYLTKPNSFCKLRESIQKVLEIKHQYPASQFNRDNFLLRL
ncbi:response regulator [Muricauda sp. W52]|uniref:Response regulator n=1 Tax=Flagellimonas abyssi TaxID=2864871 RepID=A0ABS7EUD0_9FLAO|nr:response regulator [Allomuricauda abyssi]